MPKPTTLCRRLMQLAVLLMSCIATPVLAERALVAVAANFSETAEVLAAEFGNQTGHEITLITGSTGTLYAQIVQGAPYHALLAADQVRPARLIDEGQAVDGSRFTYATGRLTLWSADAAAFADGQAALDAAEFDHLAIANPELAPYGAAAMQVLRRYGVEDRLAPKIVLGQNIGQTFAMVATGNAQLGLVATSQLGPDAGGSRWDIPHTAHDPIRQDAVLLLAGQGNAAAEGFLAFLASDAARDFITASGYGED